MKKFNIKVNGIIYEVEVEELNETNTIAATSNIPIAPQVVKAAETPVPTAPKPQPAAPIKTGSSGSEGSIKITAPMPGNILKVLVNPGQKVKKNETLCILEAMKMENDIVSPVDAIVSTVSIKQGSPVNAGDLILTLE